MATLTDDDVFKPDRPAEVPYWYTFAGGTYTATGPLPGFNPEADSADEELTRLGFVRSQTVGDPSGLSYELREHEDVDKGGWVVLVQTAGRYCYLLCHTWPDLIELLAKLSTVALADCLRDSRGCEGYLPVVVAGSRSDH
jgi:hypothetical protein